MMVQMGLLTRWRSGTLWRQVRDSLRLLLPPPYDIFFGGVSAAMSIVGPFLFVTTSGSGASNILPNQIWENLTGKIYDPMFSSIVTYELLGNASGFPWYLFDFTDQPSVNPSSITVLDYLMFTVDQTIMPLNRPNTSYKPTSTSFYLPAGNSPVEYSTSISMPIDQLQSAATN